MFKKKKERKNQWNLQEENVVPPPKKKNKGNKEQMEKIINKLVTRVSKLHYHIVQLISYKKN